MNGRLKNDRGVFMLENELDYNNDAMMRSQRQMNNLGLNFLKHEKNFKILIINLFHIEMNHKNSRNYPSTSRIG